MDHELSDVHAGFRKGRGNRDQTTNIHWIIEIAREFQNNIYFCFLDYIKAFVVVNKADVFLELSCFFDDPTDVDNLISGSSAFSKSSLNFWKFMLHILLKLGLENFEHYPPVCDMNAIVRQFEHSLALPFFGTGKKTDLFQSVAIAEFSIFAVILIAALSQHHLLGFEIAQLEFHHLH